MSQPRPFVFSRFSQLVVKLTVVVSMSRLASGVMSTQQVPRTHRTSHTAEARQILRFWGRFQSEHQRLFKVTHSTLQKYFWQCTCCLMCCILPYLSMQRSEMCYIQSQTGLTMHQVQTSLTNFRKRERVRM